MHTLSTSVATVLRSPTKATSAKKRQAFKETATGRLLAIFKCGYNFSVAEDGNAIGEKASFKVDLIGKDIAVYEQRSAIS
ncbi:hypothetical protein NDU88_005520 [Pleurodeles waltl]|uniref:Uncharacterized protein n=1 Tax=Pleurodeles waltl TaxID=8319 RepID=A0AAV7LPB8_PLEWA|nr:hypothetical protein NDU88_005520 [Pleurodeles waltl]